MKYLFIPLLALGMLAGIGVAQNQADKEPLYIYLYARITDHINIALAEDQVRRLLPTLEKYERAYPQANVSASLLFSGAVSDAFAKGNSQTHIVDLIRSYIRRGIIEPGYDGSDEPTYEHRPSLEFADPSTPEQRWTIRHAAAERFLTEARDPLSGAPVPGQSGGLKRMQEVFGDAVAINGLTLYTPTKSPYKPLPAGYGRRDPLAKAPTPSPIPVTVMQPEVTADSETSELLPHNTRRPIIFGVPDVNPYSLPGFRGLVRGFGKAISPLPNTAPEIYWQDNILRTSEAGGDVVRLVHANQGVDPLKTLIDKADRSRIHVVHVELVSEQNYLQSDFRKGSNYPPLRYAYEHPDNPQLPTTALLAKTDVDAVFAKEEQVLDWLTKDFFPAETRSSFISNRDLTRMIDPPTGFTVSMARLREADSQYLNQAGDDTFLPPLFQAEGHYLSLADLFQVSVDALASLKANGKMPEFVKVIKMFGPVELYGGHGPNEGDVSLEAITKVCAEIEPTLRDSSTSVIPKNMVPSQEIVDGIHVNSAQFIRLMGRAIVDPTPGKKYPVRMTYMITSVGQLIPKLRPGSDFGFVWTLKPAVFLLQHGRPVTAQRLSAQ